MGSIGDIAKKTLDPFGITDDGPKPPKAKKLAQAQADANLDAINQSAKINRYDVNSPFGSVSWDRPTDDPSTWSQNIQLSPEQQAQLEQQFAIGQGLGNTALSQISGLPSSPLSFDGLPAMPTSVNRGLPTLSVSLNTQNLPQLSSGVGGLPGYQTGIDRTGMPQLSTDLNMQGMPQLSAGVTGLPEYQTGVNTEGLPQLASSLNTQGFQGVPGAVSTEGMPQLGGVDTSGYNQLATALDTQGLPQLAKDYSGDAMRVEQATFDRAMDLMNPQFELDQRRLETKLANQGLPIGSEAYEGELTRFNDRVNQARLNAANDAVLAGRNEQSRMFGIDSAARGQLTNEQLASAGLGSSARGQYFGEDYANAGLDAQNRGQMFGEGVTNAGLSSNLRQQQLAEALAGANLSNSARAQQFGEGAANLGFYNDARASQFGEGMSNAALAAATRGQLTDEQLAAAGLSSGARNQLYGESLNDANLWNAARGNAFTEGVTNAGLASSARGQLTDEQLASAGLASGARGQLYGEGLSDAGLQASARQQGVSERMMERNQPFNELAMTLGNTPALQTPQVPQTAQYQMAPPDIAGLKQQNYATQAQQQAAKKGGMADMGSSAAMLYAMSDKRLKDNIVHIADWKGRKLYGWDWNDKAEALGKAGPGFGVIADEVELSDPHLVTEIDGYKAVNYGGL